MTSRDDATRAAVSPLLAELRSDLLVMPQEHIAEQHLEMMALEARVLATPRFVQPRSRRRMPAPKRALIAFIAAIATIVSCGLSAAGALPAPLQHITESIAHTFGVPHANDKSSAPQEKAADAPEPSAPVKHANLPIASASSQPKVAASEPTTKPAVTKPTVTSPAPTTTIPELPSEQTPVANPRPRVPSQRIQPVDGGPRPSENSSNTPPGYPADWRSQAIASAQVQLSWVCTVQPMLTVVGCPQQVTPLTADPQSVQWTLLNDPTVGAAVVARTKPGDPAKHTQPDTSVTVYVAFQMEATYMGADGSGPYRAYSAGIGAASMRWNGTAFVAVGFGPGSVAGELLPGVKPPSLPPAWFIDDAAVFDAVHTGFTACTATTPTLGPVLTCPQTTAAGEQWTVTGDPAQGATVAYDATEGLYTVTGTYAMTSNLGNAASGPYTATLFFDGTALQVLAITSG